MKFRFIFTNGTHRDLVAPDVLAAFDLLSELDLSSKVPFQNVCSV